MITTQGNLGEPWLMAPGDQSSKKVGPLQWTKLCLTTTWGITPPPPPPPPSELTSATPMEVVKLPGHDKHSNTTIAIPISQVCVYGMAKINFSFIPCAPWVRYQEFTFNKYRPSESCCYSHPSEETQNKTA